MTLHICRRLQVMMPVSEGVSHGIQALTKLASATSDGETLTNTAYYTGSGKTLINESETYAPTVKVNGVVSGCAVTPSTSNDEVSVAAGVANILGVAITVTADSTVALGSLPASGKYCIYTISIDNDGTTFTSTKGTDGDALDWTAYGGAGQMALCPADDAVVGYVTKYSNVAGVVAATAIYAGESANISYTIDAIRGYFILPSSLPLSFDGGVSRPVYASWYSQDGTGLQAVAEVENCKITVKVSTLSTTPASEQWERKVPGRSSFTVSIGAYKTTDNYLLDKVLSGGMNARAFIKARVNSSDSYYFIGEVCMTGIDLDLKYGEIKLPFTFDGTGELCRVTG
jgi:hypothetical protein